MRYIILLFFILILTPFKSYGKDDKLEIKKLLVGELVDFDLSKEKINISNLKFENQLNEEITFSNYSGNVLLINFWATWCAPCVKEMPSLDRLQGQMQNKIKVIAVSEDRGKVDKVKKFFKEKEIKNLEEFHDKKGELAKELNLIGLPTSLFIDKKGEIIGRFEGEMEWDNVDVINLINYLNDKY